MSDVETPEREGATPDELCAEICEDFENVEITADETEFLLQEALALNKRLKSELQRKNHRGGGGGAPSSLDESPLAAKPPRRGGKGSRTMLPPINHSKQGAALKSKKSSPPKKGRKLSSSDRVSLSAGSVKRQPSASKGKPSRTSRSAENRPEWDDRFSY